MVSKKCLPHSIWRCSLSVLSQVIFAPFFDFRVLVLEPALEGPAVETLRTLEYRHALPPPQRDCYLTDPGKTFDHSWCPLYWESTAVGNSLYFAPFAAVFPPKNLGSVLVLDTSEETFRALDPFRRLRPPNRSPAAAMEGYCIPIFKSKARYFVWSMIV